MVFRSRLVDQDRTHTDTNPYNPEVPSTIQDKDPELHEYLVRLTDTVRTQHNKAQAGDTSFPWQVLTALDDSPQYTLGSQGKFSHPEFGLIRGIYVQFDSIDPAPANAGVGAFVRLGTWVASNRIDKSSDKIPRGMLCSYKLPTQDQYGWLITVGINLQSMRITGTRPKLGDVITWEDDGTLRVDGKSARSIGRVTDATNLMTDGGSWWVGAGGTRLELGDGGFVVSRALQAGQTALTADLQYGTQIAELRQYLELIDGANKLSLEVLSRRVTVLTKDRASIEYTERLTAMANFAKLGEIAANNAGFAASLANVSLVAVNESTRSAGVFRDEAGYHAYSSSQSANTASLSANDGAVSAQASATSAQSAKTDATDAGVSAEASRTAALRAEAAVGDTQAAASQAEYARSQAFVAADGAAASATTARGYRDESQVAVGDARTQATNSRDSATSASGSAAEARDSAALAASYSGVANGGNLVSNTGFATTDGWGAYAYLGATTEYGINLAGDMWHPIGENVLGTRQTNRTGNPQTYAGWISAPIPIQTGYLQASCYIAAHRCPVAVALYFYGSDDSVLGATLQGPVYVTEGGKAAAAWNRVGIPSFAIPANTAYCRIELRKYDTDESYADSYVWFWRPMVCISAAGQTTLAPYAPGNATQVEITTRAAVTSFAQASADRDTAIGVRIDTVTANYKAEDTRLNQELINTNGEVSRQAQVAANANGVTAQRVEQVNAAYAYLPQANQDRYNENVAQSNEAARINQEVINTNAQVASVAKASADRDGALGSRIDTVDATFRASNDARYGEIVAANSRITNEASASAGRDGALGTRIDTVQASYNGLDARVTTTTQAISDVQNKTYAYLSIVAQTPGSRTQFTISAGGNNPGFDLVGDVRIFGNLIVSGTITSAQMQENAATQTFFSRPGGFSFGPGGTTSSTSGSLVAPSATGVRVEFACLSTYQRQQGGTGSGALYGSVIRIQNGGETEILTASLSTGGFNSVWGYDFPAAGPVTYELRFKDFMSGSASYSWQVSAIQFGFFGSKR